MDKIAKLRLFRTSNFPRQKVERFYNQPLYLVRSGKQMDDKTLCFRCDQSVTKPELRQVLTKLYGLDVNEVATWNRMGKQMRNRQFNSWYRRADYKKVIVTMKTPVPAHLQNYYY